MSFSYKTLNSNDISLTSYIANKQWEVNNTTLSQNGVTIYIGENLPIDKINPFDPINDSQTSNEEYRRLIYDSIKNLYYQNYTSGSLTGQFFHSSSFFNYEQSTLTSGSMLAANRNIPTITGSSAIGRNPTAFNNALYDISSSIYDETGYDPDKGSKIVVISIDQNVFGSGLSPKSVIISGSTYNIQDDGEGNLFDTLATSSLYVGNAFYSQGLLVITHQDYLCIFGAPPTTANDYYLYQNTEYASQSLQILNNDFADCGALDPTSVQLMSVPGFSFPNYTIINGVITITPDQTSVIPGNYQLEYTVGNFTGIRSNTSSINLTITSLPLEINNLISSSACFGSTASVPITFSINYGVPPYSYSLDNETTYTGIPGFFNKTVSGSMTASLNNVIYVKDYLDTIITQSFNSWYPPISYTTSITKLPCSSTSSDGRVTVSNDSTNTATSASIDGGSYFTLPKEFTGLSTGSHTINVKDSFNCNTSSIVNLEVYPALTASVTQSNVSCYGGSNGSLTINLSNVIDTYTLVNLIDPTGSYIYNDIRLNTFPNNSITASGLTTGSYTCSISPDPLRPLECQNYSNIFTITSPTALSFNATASYIDSCSNAISFSAAGGTPPYYYYATENSTSTLFNSETSSISLNSNNSGSYNLFVVDGNGCVSATSSLQVFGRNYAYSGSYCVTSSGTNTGYVSSSGIQQVFNSGPYSGSLVTSSYSSGSTLFGPILNFTQSFVSGTVDDIFKCGDPFYRYYQDTASCPISGCFAPTLLTATPISCSDNWNTEYFITYNSASANSTYTIIEYNPIDRDFNSTLGLGTHIITNATPLTLPLNYFDDTGFLVQPNEIMYFRAYNSCSNGATSSYSNIISASCEIVEEEFYYESITVTVINNSGNNIQAISANSDFSSEITILIPPIGNNTYTFTYNGDYYPQYPFLDIGMIGFQQLSEELEDGVTFKLDNVVVSSNSPINGQVYTTVTGLFNYNYPGYDTTEVYNSNYNSGINSFDFISDSEFNYSDLRVEIDRQEYEPSFNIVLTLTNNVG
jgi:hypothetical protein